MMNPYILYGLGAYIIACRFHNNAFRIVITVFKNNMDFRDTEMRN